MHVLHHTAYTPLITYSNPLITYINPLITYSKLITHHEVSILQRHTVYRQINCAAVCRDIHAAALCCHVFDVIMLPSFPIVVCYGQGVQYICCVMQVFFIKDGIMFPDLVHSLRPNPKTHIQEGWRIMDFLANYPESTHIVSISLSLCSTLAHASPHVILLSYCELVFHCMQQYSADTASRSHLASVIVARSV